MKIVNLFSSKVRSKLLNIIRHQDQIFFDFLVWTFFCKLLSQAVLLSSLHLCIAPILFLHLSFCQPRKSLHRFLELLAALPKAKSTLRALLDFGSGHGLCCSTFSQRVPEADSAEDPLNATFFKTSSETVLDPFAPLVQSRERNAYACGCVEELIGDACALILLRI